MWQLKRKVEDQNEKECIKTETEKKSDTNTKRARREEKQCQERYRKRARRDSVKKGKKNGNE